MASSPHSFYCPSRQEFRRIAALTDTVLSALLVGSISPLESREAGSAASFGRTCSRDEEVSGIGALQSALVVVIHVECQELRRSALGLWAAWL